MPYTLKSISISGMHNITTTKTYAFKDFNYLYGPNGAGKSTVLTAIQWALLGYIPGTEKRVSAIWEHHNPSSRKMAVDLCISSGKSEVVIHRELTMSGKSVQTTFYTEPEGFHIEELVSELELPIFNFSEFLTLSRNAMKDWFIQYLPEANTEFDFKNIILGDPIKNMHITNPDFVSEYSENYCKIWMDGPKGVEGLKAINAQIKSDISFMRGQSSNLAATMQSLIKYDDVDTSIDPDQLAKTRSEKMAERDELVKLHTRIENNNRYKKRYSDFLAMEGPAEVDVEAVNASIREYQSEVSNKTEELASIEDEIRDAQYKLRSAEVSGDGTCPYTHRPCEDAKNVIEVQRNLAIDLKETISKLKEKKDKLKAIIVEVNSKIDAARLTIQDRNRWEETCEAYESAIETSEELDQDPHKIQFEIFNIETDISKIDVDISRVLANKRYEEMYESLVQDKLKTDEAVDILKKWEIASGANGYQTTLAEAPFKALERSINENLHMLFANEGSVPAASFVLESKSNTFEFGMIRDNIYRPFKMLSSGEKCMYTLALFMSLSFNDKNRLPILLIDDMLDHLDSARISGFFESLSNVASADKQFIIAGVQKCETKDSDNFVINI